MSRLRPKSAAAVLALPVALAMLSIGGLILGLTGSGWRDTLSTCALALPLALSVFHVLRRSTARRIPQQKVPK